MNLHQLIQQRDTLLRRARLANVAFAHERLGEFARRIARAQLHGTVSVHVANPEADRFWPTLVAHEGSQAVIDEHFLDEDVVELADILGFLSEENDAIEFTFPLETLEKSLLPPLRRELERAGVELDEGAAAEDDSTAENSTRAEQGE